MTVKIERPNWRTRIPRAVIIPFALVAYVAMWVALAVANFIDPRDP